MTPDPTQRPLGQDDAPSEWDARLPARWYARGGRRILDWVLLAVLLPPALAVMVVVGLANLCVFRDPRQVFFSQPRIGWRGRPFRILKFRTMKETRDSAHGSWSSGKDHLRVTRFGRFLRNTHLDELPQLINVLRGEMGFIGPRPEMVEIEAWASQEIPGFGERLALRPGITGQAQITQGYTGRDAEAYAEKSAINEAYVRDVSLWLDLRLVVGTVAWMLRGKGWDWKPAPSIEPADGATESDAQVESSSSTSDARKAG